jgi:hypothetical protein
VLHGALTLGIDDGRIGAGVQQQQRQTGIRRVPQREQQGRAAVGSRPLDVGTRLDQGRGRTREAAHGSHMQRRAPLGVEDRQIGPRGERGADAGLVVGTQGGQQRRHGRGCGLARERVGQDLEAPGGDDRGDEHEQGDHGDADHAPTYQGRAMRIRGRGPGWQDGPLGRQDRRAGRRQAP